MKAKMKALHDRVGPNGHYELEDYPDGSSKEIFIPVHVQGEGHIALERQRLIRSVKGLRSMMLEAVAKSNAEQRTK